MDYSMLRASVLGSSALPKDAEKYFDQIQLFRDMMMRYQCAMLEVQTKLQVLNNDMAVRYQRNPIEAIKTRIKDPISIVEKMKRRGLNITVGNMVRNLNDVAGIRVICSFIDDIYEVARMLARQDDIKVLTVKDYIKNPKDNGYRSYHMIVEIPVFFSDKTMNMRVEVQIRTIAMDFWASLEHDLKYKKNDIWSEDISSELLSCAEVINDTDNRMMAIRDRIYEFRKNSEKYDEKEKTAKETGGTPPSEQ